MSVLLFGLVQTHLIMPDSVCGFTAKKARLDEVTVAPLGRCPSAISQTWTRYLIPDHGETNRTNAFKTTFAIHNQSD